MDTIQTRQATIAAVPDLALQWNVVESLPIHKAVKKGTGNLVPLFINYRQSMANLAACGVQVICCCFLPLLDWTRTDLADPVGKGGTAPGFSRMRMATLEI